MINITIDKNIPLTEKNKNSKYPFLKMEVGDSFFIKNIKGRDFAAIAWSSGKRLDMKFAVRTVEGGCRCWRIENPNDQN